MSFPRKVPLLYKLPHDLETRLGGSLFMYKGRLYSYSFDGELIRTKDILSGEYGPRLPVDDPDIDISSIELGYVNSYGAGRDDSSTPKTTAVYVTRAPLKQWRQGVHPNNVQVVAVSGSWVSWSRESLLYSRGFAEACMGVFPTLAEALKVPSGSSVALSRTVALHKADYGSVGVYYKCKAVGYFDNKGSRFNPSDQLPDWFIDEVYRNEISVS